MAEPIFELDGTNAKVNVYVEFAFNGISFGVNDIEDILVISDKVYTLVPLLSLIVNVDVPEISVFDSDVPVATSLIKNPVKFANFNNE